MRFSLISLTFLSVFFACVAASPVPVPGTTESGPILSERGLQKPHKATSQPKKQSPQKVAAKVKQAGASCGIRPSSSTKRPRDLEFALLDRRGDLYDKELTHYQIDFQKLTGGSNGDIFKVLNAPDLLAKKSNFKVGRPQAISAFKQEAVNLQAVGQFVDWGYKYDGNCQQVYFIIMRRVNGTPLIHTATYQATRGNAGARRALLDYVVGLVAQKMVQHHKASKARGVLKTQFGDDFAGYGVSHGDPNAGNILCVEDRVRGGIVSVDLVDWGIAEYTQFADYSQAFTFAKETLDRMYNPMA